MLFVIAFTVLLYLTFAAFLVEDIKAAVAYPIPLWERAYVFLFGPIGALCFMFFWALPDYLIGLALNAERRARRNPRA